MFLDIIYLCGSLYIIYYLFNRIMNIGSRKWKRRGFELISSSYSFLERVTEHKTIEEVDEDFYCQIKKKRLNYAIIFELRNATLFIKSPEVLRKIMISDFETFVNRREIKIPKMEILHKMLLNLEGQEWRDMRNLLNPIFTTGKFRRMFNWFHSCSKEVETLINNEINNGRNAIDIEQVLGRCSMDIAAASVCGIKSNSIKNEKDLFYLHGKKLQDVKWKKIVDFCSTAAPKILEFFQLQMFNKQSADFILESIEKALGKITKEKPHSKDKQNNVLQLMVNSREDRLENTNDEIGTFEKEAILKNKGKPMLNVTNEDLISNAFLFMSAGFESIESLLVFVMFELAVAPEIQEKLAKEIKSSFDGEGGKLTFDSVNKMEYLDRIFSETLRKHPPIGRTERVSSIDYRFPDTNVVLPKGTKVVIPIYAIHHDPAFYPNPELFNPDRFLPEEIAKRNPYSYLPFGHGPRNCIGMRFSLIEAKTIIANIILNFIVEPNEKTEIPIKHMIKSGNTKPKGGCFLSYNKRNFH